MKQDRDSELPPIEEEPEIATRCIAAFMTYSTMNTRHGDNLAHPARI